MASLGINWDGGENGVNSTGMSTSSVAQLMPKFSIALQSILVLATFKASHPHNMRRGNMTI